MLTELSTDTLQNEIDQHESAGPILSWCGNCRIMKPKFKKMSTEYPRKVFYD